MSMKQIFTIYDSKAENYFVPIFELTIGAAIRKFSDAVNEKGNIINRHPEDFTFFHLGEYDDASASFNLLKTPVSLGLAIEHQTSSNHADLFDQNLQQQETI